MVKHSIERVRRLFGRKPSTVHVGVEFAPEAVTLVAVRAEGGALEVCASAECAPGEQVARLSELVERHNLTGAPATLVLPADEYQVQQLEAPQVPDEELAAATRWRVKDLTDIPVDQAAIAAFKQHTDRPRSHPMMFAAVARQERVDAFAGSLQEAGLEPQRVAPREAALAELAAWVPDAENGVALLQIGPQGGLMTISRGDRLYLARSHQSGSEALAQEGSMAHEGLVLELQRSLDYYESQLSNGPVARVLVTPSPLDPNELLDHLNAGLAVPAAALDLEHIVEVADEPEPAARARATLALAAALSGLNPTAVTLFTPREESIDWLSADAMAVYAGIVVLCLTATSAATWFVLADAERRAGEAGTLAAERAAEVEELEDRLATREPSRALLAERERLLEERRILEAFEEHLADLEGEQLEGFSALLEGLGRQQLDGLWLRRIELEADGAVALTGSALEGALIPRYLDGLSEEAPFVGRRFREFRIDSPGEGAEETVGRRLDFRLASRRGDGN